MTANQTNFWTLYPLIGLIPEGLLEQYKCQIFERAFHIVERKWAFSVLKEFGLGIDLILYST